MRKNLELKLSWYSLKNWEDLIKAGYLPILAIHTPKIFKGTPIHYPQISPRVKDFSLQEYKDYLKEKVIGWKIINTLEVLSHVSCAPKGVVILTDTMNDPYRSVLGEYLGEYLNQEVTEYEYNRD